MVDFEQLPAVLAWAQGTTKAMEILEKNEPMAKKIEDLARRDADAYGCLVVCFEEELRYLNERLREQDAEMVRKISALSDCLSEKAEENIHLYEQKVVWRY